MQIGSKTRTQGQSMGPLTWSTKGSELRGRAGRAGDVASEGTVSSLFLPVPSWGRVLSTGLLPAPVWQRCPQAGTVLVRCLLLFLKQQERPEDVNGTRQWLNFRETYDKAYSGFINSILKMVKWRPREVMGIVCLARVFRLPISKPHHTASGLRDP